MTPLRHVLALDDDAPICGPCTTALGGQAKRGAHIPAAARPCGHCGQIRICVAVGSCTWPATLIRPEPRQHPDDYSEIEALLGRRR